MLIHFPVHGAPRIYQKSVIQVERIGVTGRVQTAVWEASAEPWLLNDPLRLLHPERCREHLLRLDPWRMNKVVATSVGGFGYGLNLIRDLLAGETALFPTHVAWGTNGTAPAVSDVGLYAEKVRTDIVARAKGDKQLIIGGFMGSTTGNGDTFQEAALVTGMLSSAWRLFARVAINPIAKSVNVIISVSWQIDLA